MPLVDDNDAENVEGYRDALLQCHWLVAMMLYTCMHPRWRLTEGIVEPPAVVKQYDRHPCVYDLDLLLCKAKYAL